MAWNDEVLRAELAVEMGALGGSMLEALAVGLARRHERHGRADAERRAEDRRWALAQPSTREAYHAAERARARAAYARDVDAARARTRAWRANQTPADAARRRAQHAAHMRAKRAAERAARSDQ